MPKVNGKIYYNNVTGDVLVIVNQNEGVWIRETTFAQDVATYPQLKEIDKNVIGVLKLEWNQYAEDFATQRPVKVVNGRIQWQPNPPPDVQPSEKPFSEKLADAEKELARQRELNRMANDDFDNLVQSLMEAGVFG